VAAPQLEKKPTTTTAALPAPAAETQRESTGRRYMSVAAKFVVALVVAVVWEAFAVWVSLPWAADLTADIGPVAAWTAVTLVAYLPGLLVAFMIGSLLLDRQPMLTVSHPTTAVTIVVAARNEAAGIADTIRHVAGSDYDGPLTVVLADNGSTDDTTDIARRTATELGIELIVSEEPRPGKSHALNTALQFVTTSYVVTLDADTLLHGQALRRLVSRLESAPPDTVAVAGAVLVRNSRDNFLTRMQEWDYYLGIAAVKRMQGMYQSTLVAQGAFSIYRTEQIKRIGGWPDAIGEDIVATWRLMEGGDRIFSEPTAVAFTDVPSGVRHFVRQRARWARGMFEGIQAVPPWRQRRVLAKAMASVDLLIPFLDVGYALVWMPGLALLILFGNTMIVSAWTLLVLPITLVQYAGLRRYQSRKVFGPLGLRVRHNHVAYVGFLLGYQVLCSVAALIGYVQHFAGTRRRWK
jgi:biofilm PGA synthesis N-glycosyltransferase PgaC